MITFTTEMQVLLPTEKEEDYFDKVQINVAKFIKSLPDSYKEAIEVIYDARGKKNTVVFKWNDSLYEGTETGDDRVFAAVAKMEYWFKHCKWFRKHNVANFTTSYTIK